MKLFILGATGATGRLLVEQGLERGHSVATIVRAPLDLRHPALTAVKGDLFDERLLDEVSAGTDAFISVLAFTPELFGEKSTDLYSRAAALLARRGARGKKLLFCTSAGVEDDPHEIWPYKYVLKPLLLKKGYEDMQRAEQIIAGSAFDWILVRPSRLTNGTLTKQFRVSEKFRPPGGSSISRADLAYFMLDQLDRDTWLHETPTLAY